MDRTYMCIDLKSFYASVECVERGLDPLRTNLVVADESRTDKTICLAVSPSLKAYGIPGRARLFEVKQAVRQVNAQRRAALGRPFSGESTDAAALKRDPSLKPAFIAAVPRMKLYMEYSAKIYQIYLRYVAAEDIHVYSVDEVFMDVTAYLKFWGMNPRDLCARIIADVLAETGITAAGGIGTNLYLAKAAMDIVAKHIPPDENGVRIAMLDVPSYRRLLWTHRPLTDFWWVGKGYARKLEQRGLFTMGDIARCSLEDEELLYQLFGVNAQHLIAHAWGEEKTTMAEIKAYKPEKSSVGSGQVLHCPYPAERAELAAREMAEQLAAELAARRLVTAQISLTVVYDISNLTDPERAASCREEIVTDWYGRAMPKAARGSARLRERTASPRMIMEETAALYKRITNPKLLVRRLFITAENVSPAPEGEAKTGHYEQMDLFTDYEARERERKAAEAAAEKEKKAQQAMLQIQRKFGKNAVLRGMNLEEGATGAQRNAQIGGHRA